MTIVYILFIGVLVLTGIAIFDALASNRLKSIIADGLTRSFVKMTTKGKKPDESN